MAAAAGAGKPTVFDFTVKDIYRKEVSMRECATSNKQRPNECVVIFVVVDGGCSAIKPLRLFRPPSHLAFPSSTLSTCR